MSIQELFESVLQQTEFSFPSAQKAFDCIFNFLFPCDSDHHLYKKVEYKDDELSTRLAGVRALLTWALLRDCGKNQLGVNDRFKFRTVTGAFLFPVKVRAKEKEEEERAFAAYMRALE